MRKVSYQLQELVFGRSSVKRRTVKQDFQEFWCKTCEDTFGLDERFHANTKFGWNFVSLYFYLVFDVGIQERRVARMFERLFDVSISTGGGSCLKTRIARYYDQTVQKILARITAGHLVQADETKARKRGSAGYVWVFTNSREVVYLYSESREADTASRVLKGFRGVLISDSYAAYDSSECPQQKCLIHLLRDMNNDVLAHPYDQELKLLVHDFASLLNPALIDTFVDQNAHLGTCEQKVLCFFECSDGRITRDGRKTLQKVFECFSPFQVVEQRLDRHSRSAKHRSSTKNISIFDYDFHHMIVPRAWVQIPAAAEGIATFKLNEYDYY